ncbi:twin-arginine translocase TatA/TatE family subunit [Kitasatospora sp. NPDC006697]|uniref:twin-arginine translocase TatA/TatE family subunit n=1 Tax=Kitasatospora sp. NPDC006697 TaxID=3364020 RepID=UPI0036B436D0
MFQTRGLEIVIIGLVVLVLFGAKRLPDSARALGKSLRILKAETNALKYDGAHPGEGASGSGSGPRVEAAALEGDIVEPVPASAGQPSHSAH